ncbi:MAG: hypothetical protein Q9207_005112 [Kuettlingeria erythrocarpa]
MEQDPSSFFSLKKANSWIVELKKMDDALKAKSFSGEKALILEQTHREGYVAFAECIHNQHYDIYPAYAKTWNDLKAARQEITNLEARLQKSEQAPAKPAAPDVDSLEAEVANLRLQLEQCTADKHRAEEQAKNAKTVQDRLTGELSSARKDRKELRDEAQERQELSIETKASQQAILDMHQQCAEQVIKLHTQSLHHQKIVSVIIDADGYIFRQDLLQSSEKGGWRAADELVHAVQSSLFDEDLGLDAENIMAWAFADFEKVAIHLLQHHHIAEDMQLYQFARGFNARRPLFHFDDVGFGKERADHKLKEKMRFYMQMPQCKHVFLACGHDSGYAAWLQEFASDPANKTRITLMAHPNMHKDVLKLGFRITRAADGLWDKLATKLRNKR